MPVFNGRILTIPAVLLLISFLSFSSQYLFLSLEPTPLTFKESVYFNINIAALLICYARAILTDPGRIPKTEADVSKEPPTLGEGELRVLAKQRFCRVCKQRKPPRSHHCRVCKRCIPKMDHHCPWTYNCVSYRTFPHFIRFVLYSVTAMTILEYHLWIRSAHLWSKRHIPMYDGPTVWQLGHLLLLDIINTVTLIALLVLLLRTIWGLIWNITTIEDWEIDRHETLLRRAKVMGGYLDGPDGIQVRIKRQEFPFDIGIWANLKQGMGTGNVLAWFWPFSATLSLERGLEFETNGMEDPAIGWPPPDPDRIPRVLRKYGVEDHDHEPKEDLTTDLDAFRRRQEEDLRRWDKDNATVLRRRQPFHKRFDEQSIATNDASSPNMYTRGEDGGEDEGEESWRDGEGQRLKDFGLDEEAEFYDEDDENVPLAELLRRKRAADPK